ncbi:MAG TPA: protein kinase [Candidatus Acidoferrales bacterium]|nr:protein kinase [Candidatus Acidoferrales bacterium]
MPFQATEGSTLGAYRLTRLLGRGGMGEVYLAQDTRLDRKVALKLLSAQFVKDAERILRFTQEARAASALNHPNIITIYDIGESGDVPYIATEFIDGQTLRQQIAAGPLSLPEALDYAIQAGSALAAAHQAGIVHRDIKPENIMVRADGYVKVLDFGLAKLAERPSNPEDSGTVLMGPAITSFGTVMGTAQYMSPEQARGQTVDARSDIFSLGIVLYEMIAGHTPFAGETTSHQIVAILEKAPLPLTGIAPIPPELENAVAKALAKDAGQRYQTCAGLVADLKEIRRWLDLEASLLDSNVTGRLTRSGALSRVSGPVPAAAPAAPEAPPARTTRRSIWLAFPIAVALVLAAWFAFARLSHPTVPFQNYALEELTDSGKVGDAVISPDGRYVVFTQSERGETSLQIRQVVAGSTLQIQPPSKQRYSGLTFSQDGNYLFFTRREPATAASTLYRISSLGGEPAKILDGVWGAVSFSPDGQRMAYLGLDSSLTETRLMSTRLDGSDPRQLKTAKAPISITTDPGWSPDGKWIAIGMFTPGAHGFRAVPVLVPVNGGTERTLGPARWAVILNVTWTPDSSGILLIGATPGITTATQIWHVPASGAEPRAVTNDVNTYTSLSSTADGKALLAVKRAILCGISVIGLNDPAAVQQIVSTGPYYTGTVGLAWSPDGKLVYTAKSGGGMDLWIREASEPSTPKRLTGDNAVAQNPRLTTDGKQLFFTSNRTTGVFHVWMLDIPTATFRQITTGDGEVLGAVTGDGQTVYYVSAGGKPGIVKTLVNGGGSTQVTARLAGLPSISPDGRQLAFLFVDESAGRRARLAIMPAAGGDFVKVFDYGVPSAASPTWTPDGSALTYTANVAGTSQIWLQPVDGTPPRQLTRFGSDTIYSWAWSSDGKRLALSRGSTNSDAVLIRQKK